MTISILEIFTIFWIAALLWVAVEYFMYRVNRHQRDRTMPDIYKHD